MAFQNNSLNEATMNIQFEDEERFKTYISYSLLKKRGFVKYAKELEEYYINLDKSEQQLGTYAAIDVTRKVVYIAKEVVENLSTLTGEERQEQENLLSMLIRHELLHSMLEHRRRTIIKIASSFGFDPDHMSKDEFEQVQSVFAKINVFGATISNISGDLDLSRYYLAKNDIDICHNLGALVLEDHPEWANYSFEQLLDAIDKFNAQVFRLMLPILHGEWDQEGNPIASNKEEPAKMETLKSIPKEFLSGIELPNSTQIDQLVKLGVPVKCWIADQDNKKLLSKLMRDSDINTQAPYYSGSGYIVDYVDQMKETGALIRVMFLSEFKGKKPGDKLKIGKKECFILDNNYVYIPDVGETQFNVIKLNEENGQYKFSAVYFYLKHWYADLVKGLKK